MDDIFTQLKLLPEKPGSYRFLNDSGVVIYVGKAKNLKKRVSSYFKKNPDNSKLRVMVPQIAKIEFIITNTETEALILESHLIKKFKPKYNVLLKDDKKFPYFLITEEEYPRIVIVRKFNTGKQKGRFFGPYTDSRAMYTTLELLKRLFPLKQCKTPKFKDRPCMYYHIGKCSAPCQRLITPEEYGKLIKNVELFLSGKQLLLIEELKKQMLYHSDKNEFEKAAEFRDAYADVKKTTERQQVVFENISISRDVIAFKRSSGIFAVSLLQIRDGRLTDRKDFELYALEDESSDDAVVAFLKEYYSSTEDIPKEVIIPSDKRHKDIPGIEKWLSSVKSSKVSVVTEISDTLRDAAELASKNVEANFDKLKLVGLKKLSEDYNKVGSYIAEKLSLKKFPHRVECFDISHIQGVDTVASMSVFINGLPAKSEYRKYKIKSTEGKPDDFMSMKEVLKRRLLKLDEKNRPDLIIIDGGKGQLSSVMSIVSEMNLSELDIVSLAKREEEIFTPGSSSPVILPKMSEPLYFIQRIRDEAHRFAITYHRKLHRKSTLDSVLDDIKGLSEKSKKIIRKNFADIKKLSFLTLPEIALLLPPAQAEKVYKTFRDRSDNIVDTSDLTE